MIRKAEPSDLPAILTVYEKARAFMAATGNPNQWGTTHPARALLEADIPRRQLYVLETDGVIRGAFAFILGPDPTYSYIEGGSWLSDEPYGTIHRIGSDGSVHGFFAESLRFCRAICPHVRIDTHRDNRVMQHLILKHGFSYRGVIYLENGNPRLAYELI